MKTQKKNAVYTDSGKLKLETGEILNWNKLDIPFGSELSITVGFKEVDYVSGSNGIVWATHSVEQAETIQAALDAQGIESEIGHKHLKGFKIFWLKITDASRIQAAIDFIWRSEEGLKLELDWYYPLASGNESFRRWVNGK